MKKKTKLTKKQQRNLERAMHIHAFKILSDWALKHWRIGMELEEPNPAVKVKGKKIHIDLKRLNKRRKNG